MQKDSIWFDENHYNNESGSMPDFHYHDYYEIYYLFSGERRYLINYDLYDIRCGDIILIKKNDLHMTKRLETPFGSNIKIYLTDDAFYSMGENAERFRECFKYNHIVFPDNRKEYIKALFEKIRDNYKKDGPFTRQLTVNSVYEILIAIYGNIFNSISDSPVIPVSENEEISKAIRYIYDNFNRELSLNDIAGYVNMNPSYFSRIFKKHTGINLTDYINHIRIKNANIMLINSSRPVTEIAANCGFDNQTYFCKVFRKINGCSAREFRKRNVR
ncbi:MAG: helix-turn-helix domain-containing protein [Ruminococcaceae bacterium]|nr:helix-turn-helix domain-containing protein [Oscillospiraceae bacterium]